jgi:hypothetical protein
MNDLVTLIARRAAIIRIHTLLRTLARNAIPFARRGVERYPP